MIDCKNRRGDNAFACSEHSVLTPGACLRYDEVEHQTMKIEIDADDIHKGNVDGQGRKYLGRDLAGKEVTIAVVEVHDD